MGAPVDLGPTAVLPAPPEPHWIAGHLGQVAGYADQGHQRGRLKPLDRFREEYPSLMDRVDFGSHQRIPRSEASPDQLVLFDFDGTLAPNLDLPDMRRQIVALHQKQRQLLVHQPGQGGAQGAAGVSGSSTSGQPSSSWSPS